MQDLPQSACLWSPLCWTVLVAQAQAPQLTNVFILFVSGETLLRKLGRTDMIRKQSVPEIVFAYFHNKYGQRALVNENVGSLVNTLTLHKAGDLRLEAFARLLSEEWDVSIFLDFLSAQALCLQVSAGCWACIVTVLLTDIASI